MAFKILTTQEIELLTENQRRVYENELAVYKERVRFVEQMERFENVEKKSYEPKLIHISAVKKAPEKEFVKPEYTVKRIEAIAKAEPKIARVKLDEPVKAVVPQYTKIQAVPVEHIKIIEQDKVSLPQISKTTVPMTQFTIFENEDPVLPKATKPNVPNKVIKINEQAKPQLPVTLKPHIWGEPFFTLEGIDSKAIKASIPNIESPIIGDIVFAELSKIEVDLPDKAVKFEHVKTFVMPQKTAPTLPEVILPKTNHVPGGQICVQKAELPDIKNVAPMNISFAKSEMKKPEVPDIEAVSIPAATFQSPEYTSYEMPKVSVSRTSIPSYVKPEYQKVTLQAVSHPLVPVLNVEPLEGIKVDISYPVISISPVKEFQKVESKMSKLPDKVTVKVPTAETLQMLLRNSAKEGAVT